MEDQLPDDGLKWFGEGFDGFPKRLPDNCVEYIIHIVNQKLESTAAVRRRLNEIIKVARDLETQYLKDYIWQREPFELSIYPKINLNKPSKTTNFTDGPQTRPYLRGRTDFGDSIADEWLVVYMLRKLSECFSDAWIRVYDTDGEFLLIEAANSLPKWLNPEIAENRLWMNEGHLKIIPLESDTTSRNLDLQTALSTINKQPDGLLLDSAIEKEAFFRLREYPSAISSSLHHTLISIPKKLAYILKCNPAYISPAVESFYLRDPVSLKPLASKDLATLYFAPEDFVTVSVRFTKVGFAQLRSQVFEPPPSWTSITPRVQDQKVALGLKLTCGFEMLIADPQNQEKRAVREIKLRIKDLESGDERLPSAQEVQDWPQTQDDEKWLDVDYNEFERELSGNAHAVNAGFGDRGAQENLRKLVSRFQDFLNDDEAGSEGIDDLDEDDTGSRPSDSEDTDGTSHERDQNEDTEFEKALKETYAMSSAQIESSGLLEEARKLAIQDEDGASEVDEDEDMHKVIKLMEKELKDHGALNLNGSTKMREKGRANIGSPNGQRKSFFGPERPPHLQNSVSEKVVTFQERDEIDDEITLGDGELSSDDEEFNDVDLGLAKNMLESFKGQAGLAGPAGNLMKALGVGMPRDEDSD